MVCLRILFVLTVAYLAKTVRRRKPIRGETGQFGTFRQSFARGAIPIDGLGNLYPGREALFLNHYAFRCLETSGSFALAGLLLLTALVARGMESAPPSSPQQEIATVAPPTTQAVAQPAQSTAADGEPVPGQLSEPTQEPATRISATSAPPTPAPAFTAPPTPIAGATHATPPPAAQATSPPTPAPLPSLEQEIALQLSQFLPWIEDPPDQAHDLAAATIINLGI